VADVLEITPTESVEVVRSEPAVLEVRAIYSPGDGKPPPKHYHPFQDEQIEVTAGTLRAVVDGAERTLTAGETLEVPRGAVHAMWNEFGESTETIWRTRPAGRTEQWFRAIDAVRREGKVAKNGMPGPLAFGVYLTEYRDVFRLAGPDWLLRPALAALGLVGRARGYRA
jgi:mannose-6-phosphate isomerase-like protein (cupin superfamily)